MADWERNDDGTFVYYGYGRRIEDSQLKEILTDLLAGVSMKRVAKDRRLNVRAVREIFRFFNKMSDE